METKNQVEKYYDSVAAGYDDLYGDNISRAENAIVGESFTKIVKQFGRKVRILDAGCGTGLGLELLKGLDSSLYDYVGIDISGEMIAKANKKFKHKKNAMFFHCDIAELPKLFAPNSFDIIVSFFGSYSHVPKYFEGMRILNDVLKPEGKIFLILYSRYSLRSLFDRVFRGRRDALAFEQQYNIRNNAGSISCKAFFYSPCIVRRLLEKTNFERVECKGLNFFFELGFFKWFLKKLGSVGVVRKILSFESLLFGRQSQFAHSLLVVGEKGLI